MRFVCKILVQLKYMGLCGDVPYGGGAEMGAPYRYIYPRARRPSCVGGETCVDVNIYITDLYNITASISTV